MPVNEIVVVFAAGIIVGIVLYAAAMWVTNAGAAGSSHVSQQADL